MTLSLSFSPTRYLIALMSAAREHHHSLCCGSAYADFLLTSADSKSNSPGDVYSIK